MVSEGTSALLRAEDQDALAAALGDCPEVTSVRRTDDGVIVGLRGGDLAAVNGYLAGKGIHLSYLAPHRQSLEEVFIDLTRGDFESMTEIAS